MASPPISEAESQTQGSVAQQQWLKTQAMNALAKTYGPMYGDPDVANAGLAAQKSAAQLPYAGQEAQATANTATAEAAAKQRTNDMANMYAAGKALQSSVQPDGSISPEAFAAVGKAFNLPPAIMSAYGPQLAQKGQVDPKTGQVVPGTGGAGALNNFLTTTAGPMAQLAKGAGTTVMNPDGSVSIIHTNALGQETAPVTLPSGSTTPQAQNAQMAQARQQTQARQGDVRLQQGQERVGIGQQNANTAAYSARTRANNSAYGAAPGTSPGGVGAPQVNHIDPTQSNYTPGKPTSYIDTLPPKGRQMAVAAASTVVNANTQFANTTKLLDQADSQIAPFTTGSGAVLGHIPGTAATNLEHNLAAIKANVAQAILTSMKGANGSTGIGRVLQSEYQNFQQTLGAIDPTQSPGAVRFHLGLVRQSLQRMNKTLNDAYKAQWLTDPYTAIGEKPPGATAGWQIKLVK